MFTALDAELRVLNMRVWCSVARLFVHQGFFIHHQTITSRPTLPGGVAHHARASPAHTLALNHTLRSSGGTYSRKSAWKMPSSVLASSARPLNSAPPSYCAREECTSSLSACTEHACAYCQPHTERTVPLAQPDFLPTHGTRPLSDSDRQFCACRVKAWPQRCARCVKKTACRSTHYDAAMGAALAPAWPRSASSD
jgi:hypothetical protein